MSVGLSSDSTAKFTVGRHTTFTQTMKFHIARRTGRQVMPPYISFAGVRMDGGVINVKARWIKSDTKAAVTAQVLIICCAGSASGNPATRP